MNDDIIVSIIRVNNNSITLLYTSEYERKLIIIGASYYDEMGNVYKSISGRQSVFLSKEPTGITFFFRRAIEMNGNTIKVIIKDELSKKQYIQDTNLESGETSFSELGYGDYYVPYETEL